jgi:hypothetical protein
MDGFFATYVTGRAGVSMLLLAMRGGRIVGADVGGIKYDGEIAPKTDGTGFVGRLTFTVPPGRSLITGLEPAATSRDIAIDFELPSNFADGPIIGIQTPTGPLNARFVKLRDIDF